MYNDVFSRNLENNLRDVLFKNIQKKEIIELFAEDPKQLKKETHYKNMLIN